MGHRVLVWTRLARLAMVALSAFIVLIVAFPELATGYLYWYGNEGIGRANLNGSGVKSAFVRYESATTMGDDIAVNNRYLYFGPKVSVIGRANVNGGGLDPEFIRILSPGQLTPSYGDETGEVLVVGEGYIYWATADSGIGRVNADGGDLDQDFIATIGLARAIAVVGHSIYWSTGQAIGRANLDGTHINPDLIRVEGPPADNIAVADGRIYWSAEGGHNIGRANIDGTGIDLRFIAGVQFLDGFGSLTVGGKYIYWRAVEKGQVWIGRANINGTSIRKNLIDPGGGFVGGIAANALGPGGGSGPEHTKIQPDSKH